jgi:hypothetical protein
VINSFSQFLVEEEKIVFFTFGRMNPPTIGHGKLLDKLAAASGRNPYKVYVSQSQDPKKNPLSYKDKVKHVRKMFPKHARSIVSNVKVKTAIDALVDLYNQGYRKVVMLVGSDRIREFDVLLNKYNGEKARHGFYDFTDIKVMSAGDRDPDADGAEGASATKQREAAAANDFVTFSQGVPSSMSNNDARRLFNDVRKGMGLKESNFKNHIALEPVSNIREAYVTGRLFTQGDYCIVKETSELATIKVLGSNYVIIEAQDGKSYRKWLTDVEPLDMEDIDEGAMMPQWLHKIVMAPKTKKMVRMYLDWRKDNPGQGKAGVYQVIKMMGLPPRDGNQLIDTLNDMVKKGQMPKHLAIAEEYKYEWGTDQATKHAKKMTPGEKVSEDEYDRYRDNLAVRGLHPRDFRKNTPGPRPPVSPKSPEQIQKDKENRVKARKAAIDNLSKTFGQNFQTNSVNEISPDLKQRYAKKAQSDIGFIKKDLSIAKDMDVPDVKKKLKRQLQTRRVGVARATEPPVKKNIYDANEGNGLWANIHSKRRRGEKMRKKGEKGAPTPDQIKRAQQEAVITPQDIDILMEKWVSPKPHEEHDEVHTQRQAPKGTYPDHVHKMLDHLSDKNNYKEAMSAAKTMKINPIKAKTMSNTDAGRKPTNTTFEKEKADRVKKQMASGKPMQKPIVLHDTHSGHTHLLAGNTRLTMNTHHGSKITPVHAITYDSSKLKESTTRQDKDIADRKGTQPARYHTGLSPTTKAARDAQFKRQTKMSDKDPAAYRPAPGDATAKTKPSRHTRAFKSMFGEEVRGKQLVHHGEPTKNFDMCPSALKAFDQNQKDGMGDKPGFHEAVVAVDKYLGLEKQLVKKGSATESDLEKMVNLVDNAKSKIRSAGLKGHDYHEIHINAVKELVK